MNVSVIVINALVALALLDSTAAALDGQQNGPSSDGYPLLSRATCGVYYYYHVSKNGGTTIQDWQKQVALSNPNVVRYIQHYSTDAGPDYDVQHWQDTVAEINSIVETRALSSSTHGKTERTARWLSVHHHHQSPGLRYMMPTLRRWKATLQDQNCTLLLTTSLRESISRTASLVHFNSIPRDEFETFVAYERESQMYYLLFNTCEPRSKPGDPPRFCDTPNVFEHTQDRSDSELKEVLGYLREFNLVVRLDKNELDHLIFWSMLYTGWNVPGMKLQSKNISPKLYNITKEMKELIATHSKSDLILWERIFGEDHFSFDTNSATAQKTEL